MNPRKNSEDKIDSPWLLYNKKNKDLYVHFSLFKTTGLFITKPTQPTFNGYSVSDTSFTIKERKFVVHIPGQSKSHKLNPSAVKRTRNILSKMKSFAQSHGQGVVLIDEEKDITIFNENRRDEVFSQLQLRDNKKQDNLNNNAAQPTKLWIYPWLSKHDNTFEFTGFDQYVIAICMFGSKLRGMDQHGGTFPLIKHDIQFFPGQKIQCIIYDSQGPNPYEEMQLDQFSEFCHFIKTFSSDLKKPKLYCHLPYYDYVLFGVELFICGRITSEALNDLFKAIFNKKEELAEKITSICSQYGIEVKIESPFENLFGPITNQVARTHGNINENDDNDDNEKKQRSIANIILKILNLPCDEVDPQSVITEQQKENEKKLVRYCLQQLQHNAINQEHRQVWQDFMSAIKSDDINNLEDLFKVANAVMVAVSARGKQDGKICSLLPLSEKQIQISYDAYTNIQKSIAKLVDEITKLEALMENPKQAIAADKIDSFKKTLEEKRKELAKLEEIKPIMANYPAVLNATVLDPLVTYAPNNTSLPFYFGLCQDTLSHLIRHKKALRYSTDIEHHLFFAKKDDSQTIDKSNSMKANRSTEIKFSSIPNLAKRGSF